MRVEARVHVPDPLDVAVGAGSVWVRSENGGTLWRIDPATARIEQRMDLGQGDGLLPALAIGWGSVWTPNVDGTLVRVDASSGRVVARIPIGRGGGEVAAGHGAVWVCCGPETREGQGSLLRVSPASNRVVARISVPGRPGTLTVGPRGVWVLDYSGSLLHVDPQTNSVVERVALHARNPALVVAGSSWIWVANRDPGGTIDQVNPVTGRVFAKRPFEWLPGEGAGLGALMGITAARGIVWANSGDLIGMDVMSGQVFTDVPVGEAVDTTAGIEGARRSVWVVDPAGDQVIEVRPRTPHCRRTPDDFQPTVSPRSGPPGTMVTVSGRTPYTTDQGRTGRGRSPRSRCGGTLVRGRTRASCRGDARTLLAPGRSSCWGMSARWGNCRYRATFRVPDVPTGRYPVSAVEFGGGGTTSLGGSLFRVTP